MNKSIREQQYNKLFIRLSGHFLAVHLEDDFFELEDDAQYKYIEDHALESLEHKEAWEIYNSIDVLTDDVMGIIERGIQNEQVL